MEKATKNDIFDSPSGLGNTIQFSILQKQDIEETCLCMSNAFSRGEPITRQMGITAEEFYYFAHLLCEKAVKQQLSLIAKDISTNKIVGCRIVEDNSLGEDEDITAKISEKFLPIFSILEAASKPLYVAHSHLKKIIHFVTLAVDENYQNFGIAKKLLALELHLLKQKNYEWFNGEFTNIYSLKAIQSILSSGLMYSNEIEYKQFMYCGSFPFPIDGKVVGCLHPVEDLKLNLKVWAASQENLV